MQKENSLFFAFPSASNFGVAKVTKKSDKEPNPATFTRHTGTAIFWHISIVKRNLAKGLMPMTLETRGLTCSCTYYTNPKRSTVVASLCDVIVKDACQSKNALTGCRSTFGRLYPQGLKKGTY